MGDDLDFIFSKFHALLGLVDQYVEAMDPMELRKCTRDLRIGVKRLRLPNWDIRTAEQRVDPVSTFAW